MLSFVLPRAVKSCSLPSRSARRYCVARHSTATGSPVSEPRAGMIGARMQNRKALDRRAAREIAPASSPISASPPRTAAMRMMPGRPTCATLIRDALPVLHARAGRSTRGSAETGLPVTVILRDAVRTAAALTWPGEQGRRARRRPWRKTAPLPDAARWTRPRKRTRRRGALAWERSASTAEEAAEAAAAIGLPPWR